MATTMANAIPTGAAKAIWVKIRRSCSARTRSSMSSVGTSTDVETDASTVRCPSDRARRPGLRPFLAHRTDQCIAVDGLREARIERTVGKLRCHVGGAHAEQSRVLVRAVSAPNLLGQLGPAASGHLDVDQ